MGSNSVREGLWVTELAAEINCDLKIVLYNEPEIPGATLPQANQHRISQMIQEMIQVYADSTAGNTLT